MTHPTNPPTDPQAEGDFALLNDLLDGRLDDDAAHHVRARIEAEPELADLYADLKGMRDCVRSYGPQGSELNPPADFLEKVQAAIRSTRESSAPGPGTVEEDAPLPRPRGRLLNMFAVAYAAAALLVVGFSVHYFLGDRDGTPEQLETARHTPPDVRDARAQSGKSEKDKAAQADAEEVTGLMDAEAERLARLRLRAERDVVVKEEAAARAPAGPYGQPGGAVPPGSRPPSDEVPPDVPDLPDMRSRGGRRPAPPTPKSPSAPVPPAPPREREPSDPTTPPGLSKGGSGGLIAGESEAKGRRSRLGPQETVYVFVTRSAGGARSELDSLLARIEKPAEAHFGAGPAGDAPKPEAKRSPGRLYRLAAGETLAGVLSRYGSRAADGSVSLGGRAADALDEPAVIDTVVRRLEPDAALRLDALVGAATWSATGAKPERASGSTTAKGKTESADDDEGAKKRGPAKDAGPVGTPSTPSPPAAPAAPRAGKIRVRILVLQTP